ncbi:MAG: TIGR00282 family metallophosphoesterase [Mariprofundaceae bacterium]|nr:TIGR00282 family metallophosphoesterase [Mariprofundaceae bacterium]
MSEPLNILIIGDVLGKAGRRALRDHLPHLIDEHQIDFCVANGENLAAGFGTTLKTADELFSIGVDVLTNGNHCWDQKSFLKDIEEDDRFVRPANFSAHAPGSGWTIQESRMGHKVAVINLIGQVFMNTWDCPFAAVDKIMLEMPDDVQAIVVDLHAETTSEKMGMGWHLDGRVSMVYGTHTHVPTCDEVIHSGGTAYQTDIGMTGSYNSIIGMKKEGALHRMVTRLPQRFEAVERGGTIFATKVSINPQNRQATDIQRICIRPSS